MTSTYTIITDGRTMSGLSAIDAADELLTDDGYEYDVRREDDCWWLYTSRGSRNSYGGTRGMDRTVIFSLEADETAAREEIARQVIESGHYEYDNGPECVTDERYAEMQAEMAADLGLTINGRVEAGETAEDYDTGRVVSVAGDMVTVAWDSGVRTTQDASLLRAEGERPL